MRPTTVRSLVVLAAAGWLAAGLAGCSKEGPAPQPVVKKTVAKEQAKPAEGPKSAAPEAPAAKEAVVLYTPSGKRDPFKPFLKVETKAVPSQLDSVPALLRYDLGELKFVGVIWGGKGILALVEDGEGKGYTVTVGTKIGRGGGTVTRITQGEIFVKEEFLDFSGTKIARESSMKLQNAGGK
jgi:Tfp pilus assembly protein PilP